MIQLTFDSVGIAALFGGLALMIAATSRLIWAIRRDPKAGSERQGAWPPLPPAE